MQRTPHDEAHFASMNIEADCERILRSLPLWFGQEESTLAYIRDSSRLPTLVTTESGVITGFLELRQHFAESFEIHCIAVHANSRGKGHGRVLVESACRWACGQGGRFLQVKTIAASDPDPQYAQTRAFYASVGFTPLELFADLWTEHFPCLQLIRHLGGYA
jgi:GNAT superfamily N-acetyltransferase